MFLYLQSLYFYFQLIRGKLISREIEFTLLDLFLNKNDTFIDIGSNIGRYSFRASNIVGNNGKIFSFEPNKEVFIIQTYITKFCDMLNVMSFNLALSDKSKEIYFKSIKTNNPKKKDLIDTYTKSKILDKKKKNNYSLTLDNFGIKKIKLIKIDCEGEEFNIIRGAEKTINKTKPTIILEDSNQKKLIKFLKKKNYSFVKIKNSRNLIFIQTQKIDRIVKKLKQNQLL